MAKYKKKVNLDYSRTFQKGDVVKVINLKYIPTKDLNDKNYNYNNPLIVEDSIKQDYYIIIVLKPNYNFNKKVSVNKYHKTLAGYFRFADDSLEQDYLITKEIKQNVDAKPKREQNSTRSKPSSKTGTPIKIFKFARKVAKQ